MDLDPLSIVTPARIKVLLLPVGHVRQSRFSGFVERLQQVNVVRLGDVSPDSRPHRTMFSPLAFPEGLVLYDLSIVLPPASHSELAPFELYREPLVVVGIADGVDSSLKSAQHGANGDADASSGVSVSKVDGLRSIVRTLEDLIDDFPKALVHQILVFDHEEISMPERIYPVPSPAKSKTTTIKTIMCDLTSRLLAEMATYAKSLQGLSFLDSPKVSSGVPTPNGTGSALPPHMANISRSGSSRSFSPASDRPNVDHRMSLPVNLPSGHASGTSTPDIRPTSPPNRVHTPPTTSSDIRRFSTVQSPPKASDHDRTDSRGRGSTGGVGVGSLGERERNKGRGRIGVVVGAMYLLAGRWPDAVKELVQSATIATNSSDYLWHAKAMDLMLVCLLMYAWAGMDFRIPENFFPGTERPGSGTFKSNKHSVSNSMPDLNASKSPDPANRAASLRTLTSLLPDSTNNILNLYARAWTFTDDKLPPLAFSQSAVRFAKLLCAIHLHKGTLDDILLGHLILNANIPLTTPPFPETSPFLSSGEIVDTLFRAYPRPPSESSIHIADHITILAGIASVLAELGYHRKKALVLKELMAGLLPALVQARKAGAAEMGVHPAASLASLNATVKAIPTDKAGGGCDDAEQGMRNFLSLVCQAYGVVPKDSMATIVNKVSPIQSQGTPETSNNSDHASFTQATASQIPQQAFAKLSGSQDLKLDILRSCINVCEALPDLGGALHFSAELLRIGGSGIAPSSDSSSGSPDIAIDEQVRLVNNISRTLSAARQLGFEQPEPEYWDDFLVRGIEVVDANKSRSLQAHVKSELDFVKTIEAKKEKNPFIYNPFLKSITAVAAEPLLVAQEEALFEVTLQNLFDFDVMVERISLVSDGVPFICEAQSTMIGPYRTQTIVLSGMPQSSGTLTIHGCTAKVRGCRERDFATFTEPWALKPDVKGKQVGIRANKEQASTESTIGKRKTETTPKGPTPSTLALNVLGTQPNLVLKSSSLSQSAIMLLEGETKTFTITLGNTSRTAIDLLLLSFEDSKSSQRQSLLSNKGLSAVELYELEISTTHKQPFRWLRKDEDRDLRIKPGGDISLEIEVLGKPGLSHCVCQVDYGHLGIYKDDIKDQFYTRLLRIPLTVTVNSSIGIVSNDIVALAMGVTPSKQPPQDHGTTDLVGSDTLFRSFNLSTTTTPKCLLSLDLYNSWSKLLTVTFEVSNPSSTSQPLTHSQSLQPGATERIPLPLTRIYLPNPHAPIPSLNPANKRQFVVSTTKSSPETERTTRETFWYREALLDRLKATWKEESTARTGTIELRNLRLTPQTLSSLRLPDLDIRMSITTAEPPSSPTPIADSQVVGKQTAPQTYNIPITTFLTLTTHLHNRSPAPITPLLRLQPTLAHQPQAAALDLSRKLLVNGLLQRALPTLGPGESTSMETGFLVLSLGVYEWRASVEEVVAQGGGDGGGGRARAATGEMEGLGEVGRRMWVAEESCFVHAMDGDGDGMEVCDDGGGEGGDS